MNKRIVESSILSRFKRVMLITYLAFVTLSLPITYYVTKNQLYAEANKELSLLVDMVKAVRNVVREDTRPYFLEKGEFFPVVVSSTVMANTVASKFLRDRPNYHIKIASDNPLNAKNSPEPLEQTVLNQFKKDKNLKKLVQTGIIKGQNFLVASAPAVAKEGCMRCHGNSSDAPENITNLYGKISGFNYKLGSVVGASFVGVPLADLNSLVLKRSVIVILILSIVFAVLIILIIGIVKKEIVKPLEEITNSAYEVSHGNFEASTAKIAHQRDDEVGSLAHSFELMRKSLELAMKRLKK